MLYHCKTDGCFNSVSKAAVQLTGEWEDVDSGMGRFVGYIMDSALSLSGMLICWFIVAVCIVLVIGAIKFSLFLQAKSIAIVFVGIFIAMTLRALIWTFAYVRPPFMAMINWIDEDGRFNALNPRMWISVFSILVVTCFIMVMLVFLLNWVDAMHGEIARIEAKKRRAIRIGVFVLGGAVVVVSLLMVGLILGGQYGVMGDPEKRDILMNQTSIAHHVGPEDYAVKEAVFPAMVRYQEVPYAALSWLYFVLAVILIIYVSKAIQLLKAGKETPTEKTMASLYRMIVVFAIVAACAFVQALIASLYLVPVANVFPVTVFNVFDRQGRDFIINDFAGVISHSGVRWGAGMLVPETIAACAILFYVAASWYSSLSVRLHNNKQTSDVQIDNSSSSIPLLMKTPKAYEV
jgi:hypothetical protein